MKKTNPKDAHRSRTPKAEPACEPSEHVHRRARGRTTDLAFQRAATIFRVLGDVARLKLLERLAEGERCVTELAEGAGSGLSTVSQQLRLLRSEHIVARRRSGKHIFYSLADDHVRDLVENALAHAAEAADVVDDD